MGRKNPGARDDDGGVKSKNKGVHIDDDEYLIGTELSEEHTVQKENAVAPVAGKKKGNSKNSQAKVDDAAEEVDADDDFVVQFGGKKKSKSMKSGNNRLVSGSGFGLLGDEDSDETSGLTHNKDGGAGIEDDDDGNVAVFSGRKKSSKSKKTNTLFTGSAFDAIGDEDDDGGDGDLIDNSVSEEHSDDDNELFVNFTGKKKPSKSNKKSSGSVFCAANLDEGKVEDVSASNKLGGDTIDEDIVDLDEDASTIMFSGKKKSSKKKNSSAVDEPGPPSTCISVKEVEVEVVETSKNKKKRKKSGRTAQEGDDIDKLLAELGEGPPLPPPAPSVQEKVQTQSVPVDLVDDAGEKEGEEEVLESAAAKKKKKKKEKEKEKKAVAKRVVEEKQEEIKGKVADKKVPKHVREMQERLARRKELEEKKKREEEEKLRKEEEERLREEELKRIAEEKKRLKKEREKEKLMKKKAEGKLLTGKQKEEARRLEAKRNQLLVNAVGLPLPSGDPGAGASKRPKYQTKKSKLNPQSNGSAAAKASESTKTNENLENNVSELDYLEPEKIEEMKMEGKSDVTDMVVEQNGIEEDEEEDEWDAKSRDDADLKLPGKSKFADEEESEPEPEPVAKEIKNARIAARESDPLHVAKRVDKDVESTKNESGFSVANKNKQKEIKGKKEDPKKADGENDLRSPICCIMGHVDTGKTKLLDCIRGTNVQEGEAGGITQQIGATYFPIENIRERTKELKADTKLNVPGLLVIDTPGHESFTNLRSRGSSLCDLAILVVDIMHGLEPQTIESLKLLTLGDTKFIVALNKVDRLYGWKTCRDAPIREAMKQQSNDVKLEFDNRVTKIKTEFMEQGLNTALLYDKNEVLDESYYSIVPTSAISGEGIPDLLLLIVLWAQKTMIEKLVYSNEIQCTVLEVKVIEGRGTTIDVVLVNGILHEGDQIVVCGMQGPIVTTIRALLTPQPMKELRVKGTYEHYKEIKAAQGIKITAQGLEHAIAGTALYVVGPDDDVDDIKESVMEDMKTVMNRIDKSGEGVYVQASTLGSLEALLEFLKTPAVNIPVSGIGIGPVHKKDVMKAGAMLEKKKKEFATILAFDVKVTPEAREVADELGVKIFTADIIYHLFDQFKAYINNLKEEKKREAADEAVFPCVLKIMPNCVFNKKDPIILGVEVVDGIAKVGTPICIPQKDFIDIGRIASIENNHKPVDSATKGQKVAIKIIGSNSEEQQKMFGRHFEIKDELVSHISSASFDVLKANYWEDLSAEERKLLIKLKFLFRIQ